MRLSFLAAPARIEAAGTVRLADMDADRLAEWQTFLVVLGHLAPDVPAINIVRLPWQRRAVLARLDAATRAYQEANDLGAPGGIDFATARKALVDPRWPGVVITPGAAGDSADFRRHRPYFVLPVLESRFPFQTTLIEEEIRAYVGHVGAARITDVFILSHGWHRNYLVGVSAYDRLMSRLSVLMHRGVIAAAGMCPLFLCVHWNSDPGRDVWIDRAGRRVKAGFLSLVRDVFEPAPKDGTTNEATLTTDFERLFEQLTCNVAPDTAALKRDPAELRALTARLGGYRYRGLTSEPSLDEKIATLWRCFWESPCEAFVVDQTDKPEPVGDTLTALRSIVNFAIAALGLPALLAFGWKYVSGTAMNANHTGWLDRLAERLDAAVNAVASRFHLHLPVSAIAVGTTLLAMVWLVASFVALYVGVLIAQRRRVLAGRAAPTTGFPLLRLVFWAGPQVLLTLPVLVYLLFTFVFRTPASLLLLAAPFAGSNPWLWFGAGFALFALGSWTSSKLNRPLSGVFRERLLDEDDTARNSRDWLSAIARYPTTLLQRSVGPDSSVRKVTSALDNQLAFFAMQRKGVNAGVEAGKFVRGLVNELGLGGARIHLIGHSFGGLVVTNAARTMVATPPPSGTLRALAQLGRANFTSLLETRAATPANAGVRVHSICTIQGAIASDWYYGEDRLVANTEGAIASIFTRYDTANSFYYPFANNGRLAAGSRGICRIGGDTAKRPPREAVYLGKSGRFAMVVEPPDFSSQKPPDGPALLNIDASRICCEGPAATGGGHDDIFKDDVVNLVWAVTRV